MIQDFKCQACGKKFTARRNTILYRLQSHTGLVEKILWLLALGVDASTLAEVLGVREITIRTWLCRSGMQGKKLHDRFVAELTLVHVQLDELWANVKAGGQDIWLWVAIDVRTKLVPVLQVGARNQEMAYSVVHELKGRLAAGCVLVFSTDGLKVGEAKSYTERLCQAGLSRRIITSFVERVNLTIRQCISKLTRRTWGPAKYTPELMEHLEWWQAYYHFVRSHESLAEEMAQPVKRKGKQLPRKYRKRTPAMMAGLPERRWTVKDLLRYPLL